MAKRSLKASSSGIAVAKRAFQRTGWTQEYLAGEVGLETRQSIWKFFSGRPVERHIFIDICFKLDLEWDDIAEPPEVDPLPASLLSDKQLDGWVQTLRASRQAAIVASCDPLQSPMPLSCPRTVTQTYVPAEVYGELTYQRWFSINELSEQVSDGLLPVTSERQDAHEVAAQNAHIVVTGRLGTGKTTFLKHLALDCAAGQFRSNCVPIFLPLQQIQSQLTAVNDVAELIRQQLSLSASDQPRLDALLSQGRVLLLLDGVDEISQAARLAVFELLRTCSQQFPQLPVLLSHRPTSSYPCLPGFKYVELAAFSDQQITDLASRWYEAGQVPADMQTRFCRDLLQPEHRSLLDLARTPLLLTLICSVFQQRETLPQQTTPLFRRCWALLRDGWDGSRGIVREGSTRLESLDITPVTLLTIFTRLAATAIERQTYLFSRKTLLNTVAQCLTDAKLVTGSLQQLYGCSETLLETILMDTGLLVTQAQDIYSLPTPGFYTYLAEQRLPQPSVEAAVTQAFIQPLCNPSAWQAIGSLPIPQVAVR